MDCTYLLTFLLSVQNVSDESMQNIAAEMNLSETAFVRLLHDTDNFATGKFTSLYTCCFSRASRTLRGAT